MKTVRLNEAGLRRIVKKIVAEQSMRRGPSVGDFEAACSDFLGLASYGEDPALLRSNAATIRNFAGPGQDGWQTIVDGLIEAGGDEADAEEFAFGIQRGDY